uniref:Apelin receptor early endogenous ligand n=1 Tax=Cyprinus carpio TaxID=7962 RepID=A0A8C2EJK1_CYPCA
ELGFHRLHLTLDLGISVTIYFLNLKRKYRRHNCPKKRCLPLHSRVPFP